MPVFDVHNGLPSVCLSGYLLELEGVQLLNVGIHLWQTKMMGAVKNLWRGRITIIPNSESIETLVELSPEGAIQLLASLLYYFALDASHHL